MLKALQLIFSIITVGLALYMMLTHNDQFLSLLNILLGLTMLVLGAIEWQKRKPARGCCFSLRYSAGLSVFIA
ncbi:hypothetical protein PMEGAPL125_18180 [Priestia megaterium]